MFDLSKHTPKKLSHGATFSPSGPPRKVKSRAQEDRIAKLGGGRRQPASGAQRAASAKGDVRGIKNYLVECKFTDANWIYVEPKVFPKIEREAATLGKTPLVQLDINGRNEDKDEIRSWFLMPGAVAGMSTVVVKRTKSSGLNLTVTDLRRMDETFKQGKLPVFFIGQPKDRIGLGVLGGDHGKLWTAFPESIAKSVIGVK